MPYIKKYPIIHLHKLGKFDGLSQKNIISNIFKILQEINKNNDIDATEYDNII